MNDPRLRPSEFCAAAAGAGFLAWTAASGPTAAGALIALAWVEMGFIALGAWWILLRRRFFPGSRPWTGAAGLLALALLASGHWALRRAGGGQPWEAESGLTALFFLSFFQALTAERPLGWMAAAGALLGAAAALRPIYGAAGLMLLLPLRWSWWRFRPSGGWHLLVFGGALAGVAAAGWSLHRPAGGPWHPDLDRLRFGLWADYLSPPQWGRYFPFLHSARPPSGPGFRAWLDLPGGLLALFPFGAWALAAPLAAWPFHERRDLGAFLKGVVLFHLALAAGLILCRGRGNLDLIALAPSLALLAGVGWLGLERRLCPGWLGAAATWLGAAAALASAAVALLLNFRWDDGLRRGSPGTYRWLSHSLDEPAAVLEQGRGLGPLDLLVRFPPVAPGTIEPLVTTGFPPALDRIAVRQLENARLQVGSAHGAGPWQWGPVLPVDLEATHRLHVEMGSLFPPVAHPYFAPLAPAERARRATGERLVLDGRVSWERFGEFFPATPGTVRLGAPSPGLQSFSGRISSPARGSWGEPAEELAAFGPVRLELTWPAVPPSFGLPLISFGGPGQGGVLFVRFVAPGRIRFGYDQWQFGQVESGEIPAIPGSAHRIGIRLPALQGSARTPEARAEAPSAAVELDGHWVWAARLPAPPAAGGRIYVGRNAVGATSARETFPGGVGIERAPLEAVPAPGPAGTVRMLVRWPGGLAGRREPLVVAGVAGTGDLLGVEYLDAGHVRFTLDHWGRSFIGSAPVATDFTGLHLLEIALPILRAPPAGAGEFSGPVRVALDGAEVWSASAPFFRSPPSTLTLAEDDIGGSCDQVFTGGVAAVIRGRD